MSNPSMPGQWIPPVGVRVFLGFQLAAIQHMYSNGKIKLAHFPQRLFLRPAVSDASFLTEVLIHIDKL